MIRSPAAALRPSPLPKARTLERHRAVRAALAAPAVARMFEDGRIFMGSRLPEVRSERRRGARA